MTLQFSTTSIYNPEPNAIFNIRKYDVKYRFALAYDSMPYLFVYLLTHQKFIGMFLHIPYGPNHGIFHVVV